MNERFKWRKLKKNDIERVNEMLIRNEKDYVSACAKFIAYKNSNDPVWILGGTNNISGLIINSKSTLLPVLCDNIEMPRPDFLKNLMRSKKIHSVQGLKDEVKILEEEIEKSGKLPSDIIDYELMSLDKMPEGEGIKTDSNLVLRIPQMSDINEMAVLQAAYEKEEVLPKGSSFNPDASRFHTANLISGGRILAAEVDGRLAGKINVNAVSFTRYQVGGVYVDPQYRGRGIAKRMAYEFIASLIKEGKDVTLFVKKNNESARRLYGALGFQKSKDYRIAYY